MSKINNTSTKPILYHSRSETLLKTNDDGNNSQERMTFLQQQNMNTSNNNSSSLPLVAGRNPSNLLQLKQQRLLEAADRKKRLITRIISVVGLLIILLCAAIVALTLKMAPKIDELVRTKTGTHPSVHFMSRVTTPLTTIAESNNYTTNNPILMKTIFRTHRN